MTEDKACREEFEQFQRTHFASVMAHLRAAEIDDPVLSGMIQSAISGAWQAAWSRAAKPAVPEWISVEDRLPEKGELVLLAHEFDFPGDWRIKVGALCMGGFWNIFGASWVPSHWMPLPAAPTPPAAPKDLTI